MTDKEYKIAYEKGSKYLESIVDSKWYTIIEDSYEYEYGLLLIVYNSEDAMRGLSDVDGELYHICINLEDYEKGWG